MENAKWYTLTWIIFHKLTATLKKPKKKYKYIKFFNEFKYIIPCSYCKKHYINMLNSTEFAINKKSLFKWTINIHNNVNTVKNTDIWPINKKTKLYYKKLKLPKNIVDIFINEYKQFIPYNNLLKMEKLLRELIII